MKSQIAAEFLMYVGTALIVTIIFVSLSASDAKELYDRKEFFIVKDIAFIIQNEIDAASQVEDGYERYFILPPELNNIPYNVSIRNNVLSVWTKNKAYIIGLPNSTGELKKGANKITKTNNAISINQ